MSMLESLNQWLSYLPEIPLPPKKNSSVQPPNVTVPAVSEMSALVRLAGLSGALAVSMGAYGSHVIRDDPSIDERRKKAFESGSRYHLIHTLALLAAPKARFPLVTGGLLVGGMILFCGPCYHYSITGKEETRKFTPTGGILLIISWLSFIL